jgi:hypothetical protein
LEDNANLTVKQVFNSELNLLNVAPAATAPTLSSVERFLQRHKMLHRPALPATRRDLVLSPNDTVTSDGCQFILIDNGAYDRIIVFGTGNQEKRLLHITG